MVKPCRCKAIVPRIVGIFLAERPVGHARWVQANPPGQKKTGRPLGSANFVVKLERILDRMLLPKKAGRKPKKKIRKSIRDGKK